MKITLKYIKELEKQYARNDKDNGIALTILAHLEQNARKKENIKNVCETLIENGWLSQDLSEEFSYEDNVKIIYVNHWRQINKAFYEMLKCYGTFDPTKYFTGGEWDETDPLAMEFNNIELLVNQVFTNVLTEIYEKFEH